jgi:hypothetical protein
VRPSRPIILALVAVVVALAAGAALVDGASERTHSKRLSRADRALLHNLARKLPESRSVRCAARGRKNGGSRRYRCRWRAQRHLSPNRVRRCSGAAAVVLRARRVRVRRSRVRCGLRVAAVDPMFGFNDNSVLAGRAGADDVARLAEGTGAGILRMTFDWRHAEPARGVYDFGPYDAIYNAALKRGIHPLFILLWAPPWATDSLLGCGGDCRQPPSPRFDGDWRGIAGMLAKRYPKLAGIEIWNEPNEKTFWRPQPDPARYADLLAQAHDAIKAVNPSMRVLGGAVANRAQGIDGNVASAQFVRSLYDHGARGKMDGLSLHPYEPGANVGDVLSDVDAIRSVRDQAGDRGTPLWVTEIGLSTSGPDGAPLHVDENGQAGRLVDVFRALRSAPGVQAVLVHTLIDPGDAHDPANTEAGFGIVRGDLSVKPAYCPLARAVGVKGRCPS